MTNSADQDRLASSDVCLFAQKPTDLDRHCLLRQSMSCSAREGLTLNVFNSCRVLLNGLYSMEFR